MKQKNRQLINGLPRRILLMLLDCGLIVFCYYLAILLRFDGEDSIVPAAVLRAEVIRAMAPMLPYVLVIYMVVFWFGGLYEIMWEYAGMRDLARLTCLSGLATGFILLFDLIFRTRPISGTVLILGAVFNTAAVAGVRFCGALCAPPPACARITAPNKKQRRPAGCNPAADRRRWQRRCLGGQPVQKQKLQLWQPGRDRG